MPPLSFPRLTAMFLATLLLCGCARRFGVTLYNNSGADIVAFADGDSYKAPRDGVLHLDFRPTGATTFLIRIDDVIQIYTKKTGPVGCWEFPASGGCNVWQLQPDFSIWYLRGSLPRRRAPYEQPPSSQPEGFPIHPFRGHCWPAGPTTNITNARNAILAAPRLQPQFPRDNFIPGVQNFGFISADVWRGAQPSRQGLKTLAAMGVKTVIDLRYENESADIPPGVRYVHLPASAWHADLLDTVAVLAAIKTSPKPVFVHCMEGRDRTGLAIAAYRLSQGMSRDDALTEMYNFRVNIWWRSPITTRVRQLAEAGTLLLKAKATTLPVP